MVGDSLVEMVQKGFEIGEVEDFLNKTLIVLIPKVVGLEKVIHSARLVCVWYLIRYSQKFW